MAPSERATFGDRLDDVERALLDLAERLERLAAPPPTVSQPPRRLSVVEGDAVKRAA
jgi:hypothetical protein